MNLINSLLAKQKKLHFTLIDPENQTPKDAGRRAAACAGYGTDAIMVGGSTVKDGGLVYRTVDAIKKSANVPTILFPNSAHALSENADYVFFMMLVNCLDRRLLLGEQVKGAPLINKWGIKPISMGYIVVSMSKEPTTVEKAAGLDRIGAGDIEKAVSYALTAKYLNMECIYLEAGSGAEKPVPDEMISAVKNAAEIPIIVGGGIRDAKCAKDKTNAGADAIVSGTVSERDCGKIKGIIDAIKR